MCKNCNKKKHSLGMESSSPLNDPTVLQQAMHTLWCHSQG